MSAATVSVLPESSPGASDATTHCLLALHTASFLPFGRSARRAATVDESVLVHDCRHGGGGDSDSDSAGAAAGAGGDTEEDSSNLAKALFDEDHYEVLGLGALGCNSTDDQIKKAYRKLLLKHHPDKKAGAAAAAAAAAGPKPTAESDPVFLAIQKAYDTLSDPDKRKAYDSHFEFDDSIPTGTETGDFFDLYGPVFLRNSRFSVKKPVPSLGDAATPIQQVQAFYNFWHHFDSWRDFSKFGEHNTEDAEFREEKRWMERQNAAANKKRKKKEITRIANLVSRAYAVDPRVLKDKEETRRKKEEQKEAKQKAWQQRQAAKKEAEEKAKREAEEQAVLAKEKAMGAKAAKKKAQQAMRAQRKALRAVAQMAAEHQLEDAAKAAEYLCMRLEFADLEAANGRIAAAGGDDDKVAGLFVEEAREREREAEKRAAVQAKIHAQRAATAVAGAGKDREWTEELLGSLAKAVAKFPGGSRNRWETIATYVTHALALSDPLTKAECIAKSNANEAERRQTHARATAAAEAAASAPSPASAPKAAPAAAAPGPAATAAAAAAASAAAAEAKAAEKKASEEWSVEQQAALEKALITHPASTDKNARWKAISGDVPGKSKKQCIQRFKFLREKLRASKK